MSIKLTAHSERRLDQFAISTDQVLVHAVVQNERTRIEDLLNHHRKLGFHRFIMVDNDSTDGTSQWLDQQQDVILFTTSESYGANRCGIVWTNEVLDRLAMGCWVLTVDADEQFVFPHYEQRSVAELIADIESEQAVVYAAPMLDMYAKGPMDSIEYEPGQALLETFSFFDSIGYQRQSRGPLNLIARGGVRDRLFWRGRDRQKPPPFLVKFPLTKWSEASAYDMSTHLPPAGNIANGNGLLLHFKLMSNFSVSVSDHVSAGEHFDDASQYRVYDEVMKEDENVDAFEAESTKWQGSEQLLQLGFMTELGSGKPQRDEHKR